jgi:transposase
VITMAQAQYIKHLWENEEKSLREIAKITDLNFRTVQKYAKRDDWTEDTPPVSEPKYPVLQDYLPIIDEWLEGDLKEPRKQRHTAQRIYNRLVKEHGFQGSYSSVRRYVQKKKAKLRQKLAGYLPLLHPPCHAQIDFGEFKYLDAHGVAGTANHLTISFPYSNVGFTQVFKGQNQECLLEGMKRIFNYIGGVPIRIKADNMTTAVVKVLKDGERELSEGFARFKLHYRFEADFCNPSSGNEKGNVENKVGYSRRNFFVPVPVIEDFDAFNEQLWKLCEEDMNRPHYIMQTSQRELWEEECKNLLTLPPNEYKVFRYEAVNINNYGFVSVDKNKYGISPELCRKTAYVKIFHDKIEIYYEHDLLKTYGRSYGVNEEITDWRQYVGLLCKKPGAVEHTRFFDQLPKLWREHLKDTQGKERKTALMLLYEIVQDGNAEMSDILLQLAKTYGRSDAESIRQCYYNLTNERKTPEPITFSISTPVLGYNPSLTPYDGLMGKGGVVNG